MRLDPDPPRMTVPYPRVLAAALAVAAVAVLGALMWNRFGPVPVLSEATRRPIAPAHVPAPDGAAATILAAGDIADCNGGAAATADLLADLPGVVAPLGDLAYDRGRHEEFDRCYQPTWGRFLDRTRPAQGNHDIATTGAAGYYQLFGTSAGPRPQGYYSYDLGAWHLVVLNSNCDQVGGCGPDSAQLAWLRDDLAAATTSNLLAYWHHPRWSSGHHGDDPALDTIWRTLARAGTDIVLNGHDHDYQRFTPLDADGRPAPGGIRQFVVGTGGKGLREFRRDDDRVERRQNDHLGVLRLDLEACGYRWAFIGADTTGTLDQGRAADTC